MVRKAEAGDVPDNTAPARKSGPRLGAASGLAPYTLAAILGCVVALLLGTWQVQMQVVDAGLANERSRLATVYARQYAAFFNQVIGQATRQMGGIADSGNLSEVIASGDRARMDQAAATFAASLASRSEVFVVPGSGPVDIPLGFAAQDMVERARRGESARPEVIPLKERPLLLLARPLKDAAGQTAGVLLVGFDLNEISSHLKAFDASVGHMTLAQKFDDSEAQTVLEYGTGSQRAGAQVAHEPTLYPHLVVNFELNQGAVAASNRTMLWLIAGIVLALVLGSIVITHFLVLRALQRNISMLLQFTESLLRRERAPAGIHFSMNLFAEVAASLTRNARGPSVAAVPLADDDGDTAAKPRREPADSLDVQPARKGGKGAATAATAAPAAPALPAEIFRACDIRGVVGQTLSEDTLRLLGKAIGSEVLELGQQALYVGRDGRLSGPQLSEAFIQGATSTGCKVINLGMVPTPVVYFAAATSAIKSCAIITGSHNPADHNGLKIVINGETLAGPRIQALKERILAGNFRSGKGATENADFTAKYLERIRDDIVLARNMKIVVDCGNGVPGTIAPQLLSSLGCTVVPLFCDVDGHFPNHHPDPAIPANLSALVAAVAAEGADLGIAFDGDGDRIGVVTPKGAIILGDRLLMLYARDLLMRSPGADIIFDVKCTRDLATVISQNGGRPVMARTGHSLIKAKIKETGAALAGELSGHIYFNDRWPGFDDALYAAARLLEILSLENGDADEVFAGFPYSPATLELRVTVPEDRKFAIVDALQQQGEFPGGNLITIDGVRVDYPEAWGLIRASNTTGLLVARFEARDEQELDRVKGIFHAQLARVDSSLDLPF